jgi:hypothetical protein
MTVTSCKGDVSIHALYSMSLQSVVGPEVPTVEIVTPFLAKRHYVREETVDMRGLRVGGPTAGTEDLDRLVDAFVRRMVEALEEPSVGRKYWVGVTWSPYSPAEQKLVQQTFLDASERDETLDWHVAEEKWMYQVSANLDGRTTAAMTLGRPVVPPHFVGWDLLARDSGVLYPFLG